MANEKEKSDGGPIGLAKMILEKVDGMPTTAAVHLIDAYNNIPRQIRNAFNEFYKAKDSLEDKNGIGLLRKAIAQLKKACKGNGEYEKFYEMAKEMANQEIAELYANGVVSV